MPQLTVVAIDTSRIPATPGTTCSRRSVTTAQCVLAPGDRRALRGYAATIGRLPRVCRLLARARVERQFRCLPTRIGHLQRSLRARPKSELALSDRILTPTYPLLRLGRARPVFEANDRRVLAKLRIATVDRGSGSGAWRRGRVRERCRPPRLRGACSPRAVLRRPWGTLQLAYLGAKVVQNRGPSVGGDVRPYIPPY